jgi:hypothetical protein
VRGGHDCGILQLQVDMGCPVVGFRFILDIHLLELGDVTQDGGQLMTKALFRLGGQFDAGEPGEVMGGRGDTVGPSLRPSMTYTKETKSSYAIERETPDQKRTQRFADALRDATQHNYLRKEPLVSLQQAIVDPRFANTGWRDSIGEQNFVSRSVGMNEEEMHFIAPRPQDLAELMDAYLAASRRILHSDLHPVIVAALVAYPFVFLHPFSKDGPSR